ncbi:putative porin [Shewanella salipaludis]|uniref:Porin n=1 Tax=Shewanella salipaludis TaxID=2723052 RepID=A0A972FRY9_9GAMM|nr:putative porin [Shewanella salipaludis]NMH65065.1 putative porin [Shewanella salipaludis]
MKKLISIAVLCGLFSVNAFAAQDNTYQHEAGLDYAANSEDFGDGFWNLGYRYYVTPVAQDKVPYALSGFLAQSSNLGVHYATDSGDANDYRVDGEYVMDSKWFIGASYSRLDTDFVDNNNYGLSLGYYFNDTSAVYANYSRSDTSWDAGFGYGGDVTRDQYSAGIKSFLPLQTTSGVLLEANIAHVAGSGGSQSTNGLNLSADWYVTQSWSVGANYSRDDNDFDSSEIRTAYFLRLTDQISARAMVTKMIDPSGDGVGITLGLNGRF